MKRVSILLPLLPVLAGFSSAPAEEPALRIDAPHLEIEHYVLPNGLEVILQPDETRPEAVVNLWYHVGSRNEEPGRRGFAHVYEHLMFRGSAHHPDGFIPAIEAVGGQANGMTDKDRTVYWTEVPPQHLELALWLEADRMGFLLEALDEAKLQNQISVVLNELRRNAERPYDGAEAALTSLLFSPEHPYSWTVAGRPEELAAATLEDVAAFFHSWYVPNNASLCVAGRFDVEPVRGWIERYFGSLPSGPARERLAAWTPRLDAERRAVLEDEVNLPRVYWAWHTPARFRAGDADCDVLAGVLGGPGSSRLRRALMHERSLAQEVQVRQRSRELGSTFEIVVTAAPGVEPAAIEAVLERELARLLEEGIGEEELVRARVRLEADYLRNLERLAGFGGRANLLNLYNLFLGEPDWFERDLQRIRSRTRPSVLETARHWLEPGRRAVLHVVPASGGGTSAPAPDRAAPPPSGAPLRFTPPGVRTGTLANGLRFHLVERRTLPLVEVHLNLRGGWTADGERPGTCSLTTEMLDEGAAGRDALGIAAAADAVGADLECDSNFDASLVRLNVPRGGLEAGLGLMADVALRPTFPAEAFARIRDEYRGRLELERARPRTRAIQNLQVRLFGAGHPYAQPFTGSGTAAGLEALTAEQLLDFHARWFRPGNAELVLVGDLDWTEAEALVRRHFGDWGGSGKAPALPEAMPPRPAPAGIVVLDRPGSEQAHLIGGLATVGRASGLRKPLQVVNRILGGDHSSRINQKLRTEMGVTYGARTRLINYRQAGFFLVDASVQTEAAGESIAVVTRALGDLAGTRPPTPGERERAQAALAADFVRWFATLERTAEELDRILVCGLPLDEWEKARAAYDEAGQADLAGLAAEQLDPAGLAWIIVGDWEAMQPGFAAQGLEPLEIRPF